MEEEEAMAIPVQETTLTTCSPPSTAASIANLEYPEEPLPTAASVASEEYLEPLPMANTESSHEYPDVPRTDDSNISPEKTSEVCWMGLCMYMYAHIPYLCMQCVYSTYSILCHVCTVCVHIFVMQ